MAAAWARRARELRWRRRLWCEGFSGCGEAIEAPSPSAASAFALPHAAQGEAGLRRLLLWRRRRRYTGGDGMRRQPLRRGYENSATCRAISSPDMAFHVLAALLALDIQDLLGSAARASSSISLSVQAAAVAINRWGRSQSGCNRSGRSSIWSAMTGALYLCPSVTEMRAPRWRQTAGAPPAPMPRAWP